LKRKEAEEKVTMDKRKDKDSPSLKIGTRNKETTNTGKPPLTTSGET